ncbi:MAG: serine/threonine protein kinase [Armatimonadetes bacterium]|nr:serine/threonine protein kinase [Armatimonadota bacterium]
MAVRLTHATGDLIGHHMVRGLLGRGAFGSVYRCVDPTSGELRVIKEMHVAAPADEAAMALEHFRAEAALVATLDHPHLPHGEALTVDGPFTIDAATGAAADEGAEDTLSVRSRHYLVMDALDGVSMEELCEIAGSTERPLAPATVLAWAQQIGGALSYLHARGLVHRDVKPANIIINSAGDRAMLIDLGLTREARVVPGYGTQPISTSGRFGTRGYAPPDPMEQEEPTALSDLHALGMTLLRALTGLDPTRPDELARLRALNLLDSLSDLEPYQAALLLRATRPDPSDRPSSVDAFLDGLRHPPALALNPSWTCWLELRPPSIDAGQLRAGQIRDLTVTIHDKRAGRQPEGEAISEDPCLRILPPALRGTDIVLPLVLRVPPRQEPGHYRTSLMVRTADEEHEVPVTYEVTPRPAGGTPGGCLLMGFGGTK